ncbi:MAG: MarR family transcriptional regulator [Hydrogenophaga sp.]|uniref:MarR family winged helix-turn-helix transcriptional regulator n=1 Tax=Hydrogenophaga sp. TaxID=1904254 RepID=UPI002722AFCD|nr:MarR family transcriptional regulator [Hydrogenophaga sp.]MDO9131628.1 MarR family transcriptional regulator [Hydrogenophaga sp.]MDO9504464.1 MarR family transcriptional regulator [Hydrogenophaga sp.]MDP1782607.1 MarR family transcriptional regulator [Hydrogenophaga sp.]MDP2248888.1 MarR family transcriptional regulator [Hydrogenophaga sp.]MDP2986660.1 MarR family transcriptional regulator [Hydrogenophaga sp.]
MIDIRPDQPHAASELFLYRLSRLQAVAVAPVGRLCQARYGISRREWRLIVMLARHVPMLSSELADLAQLDRARTSRIITALVEKKLIARVVIPSDRRQARVSLTERGRALYDEFLPVVIELNRQLLLALEPHEVEQLDALVLRLADRARANLQALDLPKMDRSQAASRRQF